MKIPANPPVLGLRTKMQDPHVCLDVWVMKSASMTWVVARTALHMQSPPNS